ncbi:hypothetical protein PPERSA_12095 [Pseudocohnilembus persalinus]|uniref:Uncharacterized protein n=1 Tax=Pseudocohnilembus persalinus TaxID=266149 RepID=A0A0V0R901_PSEPJ|nr:hypothetical protein PPERSA_12095 [Pseudocohnilembus persalinus]|eukprot:KRX10971.1 hypothetical protein PPERSA_12095 [Pseudocohnilembus persalinus]
MGDCQSKRTDDSEDQANNQQQPQQQIGKITAVDQNDTKDQQQIFATQNQNQNPQFANQLKALQQRHQIEIENAQCSPQFMEANQIDQQNFLMQLNQKHEEEINKLQLQANSQINSPFFHNNNNQESQQDNNQYQKQFSDIMEQFPSAELTNFYIVTTIFSPIQTKQKLETYKKFAQTCEQYDIKLITIEYTYMGCPFVATEQFFEPYHFQIRIDDPMFLKYNLVNSILEKLPNEWGWLAIIDYNVIFKNFDWIQQAKQNLQFTVAQQLYEYAKEIPTTNQIIPGTQSNLNENMMNINMNTNTDISGIGNIPKDCLAKHFANLDLNEFQLQDIVNNYECGKAWAFRRDFIDVFGLPELFITGFEEIFFLLSLSGQCASIAGEVFSEQTLRIIQSFEKKYQQKNIKYGYINNCEIDYVQIGSGDYNVNEAIELMKMISENLSKDSQGIYVANNDDISNINEGIKNNIL